MRTCCSVATLLVLSCAGCGESAAERRVIEERQRMAALTTDPELADPLGKALLSQVEEHARGWIKHEKLYRGTLAERGRQAFLAVLPYGHCYRVLSAGGPGVRDLDLAMFDANNVEIARDVTEDANPGLGVGASICPGDASAYRIEARMRSGRGDFVLGVFRTVE